MSRVRVQCGYLPLVDSAPLIIAQELRFAAEEGLELSLVRQPSWSSLRDMLALGHLDFAHMLSPMPVAMSLGLGGMPAKIDALMVLAMNGTVIGVSRDFERAMRKTGWTPSFGNPKGTASAVFAANARATIRIGVPFPFSMHRMLLEYWVSRDPAFQPDRVEIITVPPPHMAAAVKDGALDMFCVGEPWGSVAVQNSDALLLLPSQAIWQAAPEKVLGARHDWIEKHPETCAKMVRAVYKAARWLDQPDNTPLAIEILARSQHLDLPDHAIDPALTGHIFTQKDEVPRDGPPLVTFWNGSANFPWRSQSAWIARQLATWYGLEWSEALDIARSCYRSDIYRSALTPMGVDMPGASEKVEGAMTTPTAVASTRGQMILRPDRFFDGAQFDIST